MRKIVLMYHDVYSDSETESGFQFPTSFPYKISAEKFESHVKLAHTYCKQNNLSLDSVEFTFDDGGVSFYTVIAPILEKYGFKGVFFISTSYIDTERFLTEKQIQSLYKRGHIIASHSHSHPRNMTMLSEQDLLFEWETSTRILEGIIKTPTLVASIPSGFNSPQVMNTVEQAGVKILYTSKPTDKISVIGGLTTIGRYVVHCNTTIDTISKILYNRGYRQSLLVKWHLVGIAKVMLGSSYNWIKKRIIR